MELTASAGVAFVVGGGIASSGAAAGRDGCSVVMSNEPESAAAPVRPASKLATTIHGATIGFIVRPRPRAGLVVQARLGAWSPARNRRGHAPSRESPAHRTKSCRAADQD